MIIAILPVKAQLSASYAVYPLKQHIHYLEKRIGCKAFIFSTDIAHRTRNIFLAQKNLLCPITGYKLFKRYTNSYIRIPSLETHIFTLFYGGLLRGAVHGLAGFQAIGIISKAQACAGYCKYTAMWQCMQPVWTAFHLT